MATGVCHFGMCFLQALQFSHHHIEIIVADGGLVEHIIVMIVAVQFFSELQYALLFRSILFCHVLFDMQGFGCLGCICFCPIGGGRTRIVFLCFWHPSLYVLDTFLIAGMIAEQRTGAAGLCSHTLPEGHSHFGVIASHGSKDESEMVGLVFLRA